MSKTASFWDKEKVVGKIIKAGTGKSGIRAKLVEKDDTEFVDLRKYVNAKGKDKGFEQHTSSGIAINVEDLDAVIKVLQEAKKATGAKRHEHKKDVK